MLIEHHLTPYISQVTNSTAADDFFSTNSVVSFGNGVTSASATLILVNDAIPEGNETFIVQITSTRYGAEIGSQNTLILVVRANDEPYGRFQFDQVGEECGCWEVTHSTSIFFFLSLILFMLPPFFNPTFFSLLHFFPSIPPSFLSLSVPPSLPSSLTSLSLSLLLLSSFLSFQSSLAVIVSEPLTSGTPINLTVTRGPGVFGRVTVDFEASKDIFF